ncbi:response regulator transcription factor [Paenibacillus sp. P26]|nr:response regulator transcription factor [Paenibacillus sp. P26]
MKPIDVFVCEDDPLFRELFVDYLSRQEDIRVVGSVAYKHQLISAVNSVPIDVLVLDINLTGTHYDGLEAAMEIQSIQPELQIIVLSSLDREDVMLHAVSFGGVVNYITKEHYRDLPEAIRNAHLRKSGLHYSSAGKLLQQLSHKEHEELRRKITPRQIEILQLLDQGYNRKEIAEKLFYNEQSINNELCKISSVVKGKFPYLEWLRLKKHNTAHIIELAKQLGILS